MTLPAMCGKYESYGNCIAVNKSPNLIENITRCSFSLGPIWHRFCFTPTSAQVLLSRHRLYQPAGKTLTSLRSRLASSKLQFQIGEKCQYYSSVFLLGELGFLVPNNGGNISPSWEACKGSVGKLAGEITIIIRTSVACRIVASLYFPPIARKHIATRRFHQSMTISICQSYYVTYSGASDQGGWPGRVGPP